MEKFEIRQEKVIGYMTELSKRLLTIASFVQQGSRIADIGTDHGYLPIYLMEQGIAVSGLAMDIRKGPLDRAKEHIREAGLEEKIETRLSNGLEKLNPGEADTVIIAGMGGPLILDILRAGTLVFSEINEFVLSPQADWRGFRLGMRELGLIIRREEMVFEDGKYYLIVRAVHGNAADEAADELSVRFGQLLLKEKNPVLKSYLIWQEEILTGILHKLTEGSRLEVSRRKAEVESDLSYVRSAIETFM